MDIFWKLFYFFFRCVVSALLMGMALRNLPNDIIPLRSRSDTVPISIGVAFLLNFFYSAFLYPFWLSPLNRLPTYTVPYTRRQPTP